MPQFISCIRAVFLVVISVFSGLGFSSFSFSFIEGNAFDPKSSASLHLETGSHRNSQPCRLFSTLAWRLVLRLGVFKGQVRQAIIVFHKPLLCTLTGCIRRLGRWHLWSEYTYLSFILSKLPWIFVIVEDDDGSRSLTCRILPVHINRR
ncbi:hypothetical protein V2G26_006151 [Clonostachys chloroleuca]